MSKFDVILACGGSGSRCNLGYNKLLLDIGGMTLLQKALTLFYHEDIDKIIIAYNKDDYPIVSRYKDEHKKIVLCEGGATRTQSIANALKYADSEYVIVHDGARAFLPRKCLEDGMRDAIEYGTSVLYTPSTDSLREINSENGNIISSRPVDRTAIIKIQTPQIFPTQELKRAYALAEGKDFTDDATLYETFLSKPVHLTLGSPANIKVTTPEDCKAITGGVLVGNGWDTHRLGEGRKLILGGIDIPHTKGLIAHSDGDVLIHAIMDAILSAMHERDIGVLFPDTDNKYKDISSVILLKEVIKLVKSHSLKVRSVTAVIMAQKPKLSPYIPAIQKNLADIMEVDEDSVSISATTTEKLGIVGREEGVSVSAVAVLTDRG